MNIKKQCFHEWRKILSVNIVYTRHDTASHSWLSVMRRVRENKSKKFIVKDESVTVRKI